MPLEWISLTEAAERYGIDPTRVYFEIACRTQIVNGVTVYAIDDLELAFATATESSILGRMSYGQLWHQFGIKRGWLDEMICAGKVPPANGDATYDTRAVLQQLSDNPQQNLPAVGAGRIHFRRGR